MNRDVDTGPLAYLFACSLAPLTHLLASSCLLRLRSYICLLAYFQARGRVYDSMPLIDLILSHRAMEKMGDWAVIKTDSVF